jgi:lipopolysaccharide/colanic/teichoic acid biosynthesis glycosyltransferase
MEAHHLLTEAAPAGARRERVVIASAVARRVLDVAVATAALLVLAPIILVVALAVLASSPGPVLFRQRRLGRDRTPFTVLKFRTMWAEADSAPHREYVRTLLDGGTSEPNGGLYKLAVDDRVTRVGRFLRSWSLDELPQLINVLRGEMSLVGPRPVIPYEAELYPDDYLPRFSVKPGLTGLWQVSGRNERTYEEMVRFDVEYAERRSLALDALILVKTVWVVLRRKGVA